MPSDATGPDDSRAAGRPGPRWGGTGQPASGSGQQAQPEGSRGLEVRRNPGRAGIPAPADGTPHRRPPPPPGATDYGSFWRRLAAWLVDEAAKTGIWLAILLVVMLLTGGLPASTTGTDLVALAPRAILSIGYDWVFWSQGWTPGTSVMRMRIVDAEGAVPGTRRGFIRVAVSLLSGGAFFVGYAWMVWHPRRQTWHDLAAGTFVVTVPQEER